MRTAALINPLSGSVGKDGGERMAAALDRAGVSGADIIELEPAHIERQLGEHARRKLDRLIVWGGDGTLRAALCAAGRDHDGLVLLPGGTMNLLLKWLYGEKGWEDILGGVMASPCARTLPAGRVGEHEFYCAMLAGAPVALADARESLRRGDLVETVLKSGEALEALGATNLHAHYTDGYTFTDGALPATSIIAAMVGPLAQNGAMEVAAVADPSATTALDVMWASLTSDWRNSPAVRIVPASSLMIENDDGGPIPVILDGEHVDLDRSAHVAYVEGAVRCLTPA